MRTRPHPVRVIASVGRMGLALSVGMIVVVAIVVGWTGEGHLALLALGLLGACFLTMLAFTERSAAQFSPVLRFWSGSATVFIARPPEQVWAAIRPAEVGPLLDARTHRGFTVPGTPLGVGEQQAFIGDAPGEQLVATVIEVIEERSGELAVVHSVTGPPVQLRYELAPVHGGTTFSYTVAAASRRWAVYPSPPSRLYAAAATDFVERVKKLVESQAATPPHQL